MWSAFWIRAPVGIDLLGLFVFGDRLIGRTSDSGSENLGSSPSPQAIFWSLFGGRLIGRTPDFGSGNLGSSPSPQANSTLAWLRASCQTFLPCNAKIQDLIAGRICGLTVDKSLAHFTESIKTECWKRRPSPDCGLVHPCRPQSSSRTPSPYGLDTPPS